jgi:hypothetical protein
VGGRGVGGGDLEPHVLTGALVSCIFLSHGPLIRQSPWGESSLDLSHSQPGGGGGGGGGQLFDTQGTTCCLVQTYAVGTVHIITQCRCCLPIFSGACNKLHGIFRNYLWFSTKCSTYFELNTFIPSYTIQCTYVPRIFACRVLVGVLRDNIYKI